MNQYTEVQVLNAFTRGKIGGNPAGVVFDANGLSDSNMQALAEELNLSEVAFLDEQTKEIRYFTPTKEIELCGHATISAASAFSDVYGWNGDLSLKTRLGEVLVRRTPENQYFLRLVEPKSAPFDLIETDALLRILKLPSQGGFADSAISNAGVPFVTILLKNTESLKQAPQITSN